MTKFKTKGAWGEDPMKAVETQVGALWLLGTLGTLWALVLCMGAGLATPMGYLQVCVPPFGRLSPPTSQPTNHPPHSPSRQVKSAFTRAFNQQHVKPRTDFGMDDKVRCAACAKLCSPCFGSFAPFAQPSAVACGIDHGCRLSKPAFAHR